MNLAPQIEKRKKKLVLYFSQVLSPLQDPSAATSKKDLKKLLKIALDVDLEDDDQLGDVETVYSDGEKVYAAL